MSEQPSKFTCWVDLQTQRAFGRVLFDDWGPATARLHEELAWSCLHHCCSCTSASYQHMSAGSRKANPFCMVTQLHKEAEGQRLLVAQHQHFTCQRPGAEGRNQWYLHDALR